MTPRVVRPVLVAGILLIAGGYAAMKEWQWQADAETLLRAAPEPRESSETEPDRDRPREPVTVQPEQIFED